MAGNAGQGSDSDEIVEVPTFPPVPLRDDLPCMRCFQKMVRTRELVKAHPICVHMEGFVCGYCDHQRQRNKCHKVR